MKGIFITGLLILCLAAVFSTGCTTQQSSTGTTYATPAVTTTLPQTIDHSGGPGATVKVRMKDNAFDPSFITIKAGTTVIWTNEDSVSHSVTYTSPGLKRFDSGRLEPGQSFTNVFNEPGRYTYADAQHASMEGTIVIE